jgi:hypothetical protein
MKIKNISGLACFLVLLLSMLFSGCEKEIDLESFTPTDPNMSLANDQLSVDKTEAIYKVGVTSNLPWRAKSNDAWITIIDGTDAGPTAKENMMSIKVAKNPTILPRSGTISVWITDKYQKTLTINQAAGDPPPIIKRNVYCKVGATGDGSSWLTPMSLSAAFALNLDAGDIIHIAAGTYNPENIVSGATGSAAADKTFEIKQNIVVIGGYPANATTGAVANPALNTTILDGNNTANHVITVAAPTAANQQVTITGITIQKGNTSVTTSSTTINGLAYSKTNGGGIIIGKAVLELNKCIITDNTGWAGGAGIYAFTNATVTLRESVLKNNTISSTAANGGGMMFEKQSNLYVYDSNISANGAGSFAGALYQYTGAFHIYNSTINGNGAGFVGSGTTGKAYGGIYLREGTGEIVNSTIHGNTASNIGGAIGVFGTAAAPANLQVISCTITGNRVKSTSASGGGIYLNAADVTVNIYNSIISGNTKGATGVETVSDMDGIAAASYTKKSSIIGAQVFDANGLALSGVTFDPVSMLGSLSNNGGVTLTVKLLGASNPATTNGMTASQLTTLGSALGTPVPASIITLDQIGGSRTSKAYIGALAQ